MTSCGRYAICILTATKLLKQYESTTSDWKDQGFGKIKTAWPISAKYIIIKSAGQTFISALV